MNKAKNSAKNQTGSGKRLRAALKKLDDWTRKFAAASWLFIGAHVGKGVRLHISMSLRP